MIYKTTTLVVRLVSQHSSSSIAAENSQVRSSVPLAVFETNKAIEYSRRDKIHAWQHAIKRWLLVVVTVSCHRR